MTDEQRITVQPETWVASLTVHTDAGCGEAEPATLRAGQAAEARVTMDSATGRLGTVGIDVFDASRRGGPRDRAEA